MNEPLMNKPLAIETRPIKQDMIRIRQAALAAVDPAEAVRRALRLEQGRLQVGQACWDLDSVERVLLVAAGKAAVSMARAAAEVLGERLAQGVVVTKYGHAKEDRLPAAVQVLEAGHPVPDAAGLAGARAVVGLLDGVTDRDRVLVLLSGGASALLPLPAGSLSLDDLQSVTGLLLRAGADIGEINAVRKHLDLLKGGQLARLAAPAPLAALILSDVVGDPLEVIASGPSAPDPSRYSDAWQVLGRYGLLDRTPAGVATHLRAGLDGKLPETPKPGDPLFERVTNQIIGSNRLAAQAAVDQATKLGYRALLLTTFVEGEARQVARFAAALAKGVRLHGDPIAAPACLVWGGETTVTVRGSGRGGRNQELALAAALALEGLPGVAVMALATDGSDGPTDAAGAIVDGETARQARRLGYEPREVLLNNDSYPLLDAVGALMRTGPTGTNVNDLLVILVE